MGCTVPATQLSPPFGEVRVRLETGGVVPVTAKKALLSSKIWVLVVGSSGREIFTLYSELIAVVVGIVQVKLPLATGTFSAILVRLVALLPRCNWICTFPLSIAVLQVMVCVVPTAQLSPPLGEVITKG